MSHLRFVLDGQTCPGDLDPGERLLDVLRDRCGKTSAKDGCAPQATCGCCTVLVDGQPKLSCALTVEKVAGKSVTTLDGLPEEARQRLAAAFVGTGALQCGFCTPGIMVRAHALLEANDAPSNEQVCDALKSHLCRCTGYQKIVEGIQAAAACKRGEPLPAGDASGRVGTSLARYEGHELALGQRPYIADMKVKGLLEGALRLARTPRAKLVAIDPAPAMAVDGVVAVVTAADVPGQRHQGLIYADWPVLVAIGEDVRCAGDCIAVVVAKTRRAARKGAQALGVTLEVLPPLTDPEEALKPDAPKIHKNGNLLSTSMLTRGDASAALKASAYVVEETFATQFIEHAFLEPESALVVPPVGAGGEWTLYTPGQGVADDRRQVASLLGIEPDKLIVELVSNGGAFGGKEDLGVQGHAALGALVTGSPCRVTLSREESILTHPKRHPITMHYRVGCDAEGNLTAVQARLVGDKGAYASVGSKVLERACGHSTGAYRVPHVEVTALAVHTNNPPCGAMRGFGANQVAFAIEGCLDRLARQVGIDGWEIRWKNALQDGDRFGTGQRLSAVGLKQTLLAVREAYRGARYAGIACGIKNVGIGNGMPDAGQAVLEVQASGRVRIHTGFTEMGQGLFTVLIQTACEETGLPPGLFDVEASTRQPVPCGMTTASRGTVLACNATLRAARELAGAVRELSIPPDELGSHERVAARLKKIAGRRFVGEYLCDWTTKLEDSADEPVTHLTYGFATQVVILDERGTLERVVAAHDVGRVMNPVLLQGQIEGSVHMGLGMALTEELPVAGGIPKITHLGQLGLLRAHHMPRIECVFVEEPEPEGPYGAKGVGEIGLVPTAGAVAGALFKYDGRDRNRLPMKDSPAAAAILGRGRAR